MNWHVTGIFLILPFLSISPLDADYFDDQGNIQGKFRTDYNSQTEGSSSNPLDIGTACLYPNFSDPMLIKVHPSQACPTGPTVYPGGPFPYSNVSFSSTSFFVLSANVEFPSFGTTTLPGGIQGAPNLSTSLSGSPELLGFYSIPVFQYLGGPIIKHKANLFIDNEGTTGAKFPGVIPFVAIGAQYQRGNASNVGRLNVAGAPKRTTWKSTVTMATATGSDTNYHFVMAIAEWDNRPRMLFVNLFHYMMDWSDSGKSGEHHHWNWRAKLSFYYPGADIAFIDAEDIVTHCGSGVGTVPRITSLGVKESYSLNWEALYHCMGDNGHFDSNIPNSEVPLRGVHCGVELGGKCGQPGRN